MRYISYIHRNPRCCPKQQISNNNQMSFVKIINNRVFPKIGDNVYYYNCGMLVSSGDYYYYEPLFDYTGQFTIKYSIIDDNIQAALNNELTDPITTIDGVEIPSIDNIPEGNESDILKPYGPLYNLYQYIQQNYVKNQVNNKTLSQAEVDYINQAIVDDNNDWEVTANTTDPYNFYASETYSYINISSLAIKITQDGYVKDINLVMA